MNASLTKVKLHGRIAAFLGLEDLNVSVERPTEILKAIDANTRGRFFDYLRTFQQGEADYVFLMDGKSLTADELFTSKHVGESIDIMPAPAGSGGLFKFLSGVLLVAVAVIAAPVAAAGAAGTGFLGASGVAGLSFLGAKTSILLGTIGSSLVIGGISQLIAGTPNVEFENTEPAASRPSYNFSGAVNTTRQGNAVPIGYGRLRVGSQIISAGLESEDVDI